MTYSTMAAATQVSLNKTFIRNMEFLQQHDPATFEQFKDYHPKKIQLLCNDKGTVNLHHMDGKDTPVYSSDPFQFTKESVEHYVKAPFSINMSFIKTTDELWAPGSHNYQCNLAIDVLRQIPSLALDAMPEKTPFLCINGIGLGYHIELLLEASEIFNLCLIEPDSDYFYASLAIIDWPAIYRYFMRPGYNLILITGQNKTESIQSLKTSIQAIGLHHLAKPLIFNHIQSSAHQDILNEAIHDIAATLTHTGFFEDEAISLAHTLENLSNQIPLLNSHPLLDNNYHKIPAFVVANGPSLDQAKEFLISNKGNGVIFSCGTALGSLLEMGIKPDFHIEMERLQITPNWIKKYTTEEQRNDSILVALNTVHPDTFKLFPKSAACLKPSDIGTLYIDRELKPNYQIPTPPWSNPTVGNTALSFATAMGFKEIYIFGLDLAYGEDDSHHSSHSKIYNEFDAKKDSHKEISPSQEHQAEIIQEKGNFRNRVSTTRLWRSAKIMAEQGFAMNPMTHYYNCSDGILLEGATPSSIETLQLPLFKNKSQFIQKLYKEKFSPLNAKIKTKQAALDSLQPAQELCQKLIELFSTNITSLEQAKNLLDQQFAEYQALGVATVPQQLMHGSIITFGIIINLAIQNTAATQHALRLEQLNQIRNLYLEFLNTAYQSISMGLLDIDNRSLKALS